MGDTDAAKSEASAARANDIVIIAVDGSKQAEEAFEWYVQHLHRKENNVILVHGLEIPIMPTRDSWDQQMLAGNKKKDELQLKFEEKLKAANVTTGRFVAGFEKPGELIIEMARKESAAYIVMGTRGLGKLRRTVMGSVSDYVVHHSPCPVIVSRT